MSQGDTLKMTCTYTDPERDVVTYVSQIADTQF